MENRFGERLRQLRLENKMTQKAFAALVELTPSSVSAYEKGNRVPDLDIAQKIAEKTNVSLDWLCGIANNKDKKVDIDSLVWKDGRGVHAWADDVLKILAFLCKNNFGKIIDQEIDTPFHNVSINFDDLYIMDFLLNVDKLLSLKKNGTLSTELLEAALAGLYKTHSDVIVTPIEFEPPEDLKELQGLI